MITVERKARNTHRCVTCDRDINPGEQYLSYTAFPDDDLYLADRPTRFAECADCCSARARRRGAA